MGSKPEIAALDAQQAAMGFARCAATPIAKLRKVFKGSKLLCRRERQVKPTRPKRRKHRFGCWIALSGQWKCFVQALPR